MTTFLAIAENSKLDFVSYASQAVGTLEKTDEGYQFTRITVSVGLVISDEALVDRANRILAKTEQHCLISRSMNTEVELRGTVTVE
jgi:organic hydroperoxide reductase OsmC/OhrA